VWRDEEDRKATDRTSLGAFVADLDRKDGLVLPRALHLHDGLPHLAGIKLELDGLFHVGETLAGSKDVFEAEIRDGSGSTEPWDAGSGRAFSHVVAERSEARNDDALAPCTREECIRNGELESPAAERAIDEAVGDELPECLAILGRIVTKSCSPIRLVPTAMKPVVGSDQ
jgi:hypothetical protein